MPIPAPYFKISALFMKGPLKPAHKALHKMTATNCNLVDQPIQASARFLGLNIRGSNQGISEY